VDYGWSVPPVASPGSYFSPKTPGRKEASSYFAGVEVAIGVSTTLPDAPNVPTQQDKIDRVPKDAVQSSVNTIQKEPSKQLPKPNKHARAHSPAPAPHRKRKSKYSPYTPEVEKALSVISAELEKTSKSSSSMTALETTIQSLEQRLRMRDQEVVLLQKERAALKVEVEKGKAEVKKVERVLDGVRRNRVDQIRKTMAAEEERDNLREKVQRLEKEGKEWKERLRELVGGEMGV
jgi:chromosome segregation ATPase